MSKVGIIQSSSRDAATGQVGGEGQPLQPALKQPASRSDAALGIREEAEFIGEGGSQIFACLHAPTEDALGGVVICSPIQAEFEKNYRREFLLARSLASRGVAALRFHYLGSGNSDGDPADATLQTMASDALTASEWLGQRAGVAGVGFAGTRWGGLVAAEAVSHSERAPLALWEPVLDPAKYFRDAFRSRLMRDLKDGATNRLSSAALKSELEHDGVVDLLGYGLYRGLYDGVRGQVLADALGQEPRSVLILQISPEVRLRTDYEDLARLLTGRGIGVKAEVIADREEAWWFADGRGDAAELRAGATALVNATSSWFVAQFSAR